MGLGAGEAVAFFASTAICGGEDVSSGAGGEEMGLGASAGEEWSGVQKVGVGGRRGETGSERSWAGVSKDAGVGLVATATELEKVARAEGGKDVARHLSQLPSATPPRSTSLPPSSYASLVGARGRRGLGWQWLGRWRFGRRGLRQDQGCSERRLHCSTDNLTMSTRSSAAASPG
jgi:hypothetical protein